MVERLLLRQSIPKDLIATNPIIHYETSARGCVNQWPFAWVKGAMPPRIKDELRTRLFGHEVIDLPIEESVTIEISGVSADFHVRTRVGCSTSRIGEVLGRK